MVSAGILFFGILWGLDVRFAGSRYSLEIMFDNVSGLQDGDPVTVSGVRKGKVAGLQIVRDSVLVRVLLENDVMLRADARAMLTSAELMSGKKIEIYPGRSLLSLDRDQVLRGILEPGIGELPGTIGQLSQDVSGVVRELEEAITSFNLLLADETLRRSIFSGARSFEKAAEVAEELLSENRSSLEATVANLEKMSSDLQTLVEVRGETVDEVLGEVEVLVGGLRRTTDALLAIVERVEQREGTLGKMVYDDEVYEEIMLSIAEIQAIIADFKENPEKYLRHMDIQFIKLFDF